MFAFIIIFIRTIHWHTQNGVIECSTRRFVTKTTVFTEWVKGWIEIYINATYLSLRSISTSFTVIRTIITITVIVREGSLNIALCWWPTSCTLWFCLQILTTPRETISPTRITVFGWNKIWKSCYTRIAHSFHDGRWECSYLTLKNFS